MTSCTRYTQVVLFYLLQLLEHVFNFYDSVNNKIKKTVNDFKTFIFQDHAVYYAYYKDGQYVCLYDYRPFFKFIGFLLYYITNNHHQSICTEDTVRMSHSDDKVTVYVHYENGEERVHILARHNEDNLDLAYRPKEVMFASIGNEGGAEDVLNVFEEFLHHNINVTAYELILIAYSLRGKEISHLPGESELKVAITTFDNSTLSMHEQVFKGTDIINIS
jgi:hypothetical protein